MGRIANGVVVHPDNPRYFLDTVAGRPLVLMGRTSCLPQRKGFDAGEAERMISCEVTK